MASLGTFTERPVLFGRYRSLVGVVTSPAEDGDVGDPSCVFINSGIIHRVGPNRIYVRMARALAARGFTCLRFDLAGIGDSLVDPDAPGSDPQELMDWDTADALDFLAQGDQGQTFILLGICSGANQALRMAAADDRVVGAVMIDPDTYQTPGTYVRHYWRRVRDVTDWPGIIARRVGKWGSRLPGDPRPPRFLRATLLPAKAEMERTLDSLVERGVRLCYVFSNRELYYNFDDQFFREFPSMRHRPGVSVKYYGDADHTFSAPLVQERLVEMLLRWTTEEFDADSVEATSDAIEIGS